MTIVTLFDSCGVRITETQYKEVPHCEGEVRVYSYHGDRLEFCQGYTGIKERQIVLAHALIQAGSDLEWRA